MASALRRLGLQALRAQGTVESPLLRRGMAGGYAKPKVDTSLDHVFGDNSNKLAFNFEPMPMGSLFIRTMIVCGIAFFPIWLMLGDDIQYTAMLDKIAAAKAQKESS